MSAIDRELLCYLRRASPPTASIVVFGGPLVIIRCDMIVAEGLVTATTDACWAAWHLAASSVVHQVRSD
jgi:hypothetical protein